MKPVVFINSHPIQYFVPLYQKITEESELSIQIVYCSDENLKGHVDKEFNEKIKWDIPLLEGYSFVFLKNRSFVPSIYKGFWGLFNPGILKYLHKKEKSIIIVFGWNYATYLLAIIYGKLLGHTICLRVETPQNQERSKKKIKKFVRNLYLKFVFKFIDKFLYIGYQNMLFYKNLGIPDKRLFSTPYAVDNKRFRNINEILDKKQVREKLNLSISGKIILYSGKYIEKKRPLDLLKAFLLLKEENIFLVMVGEGELRPQMEKFINENMLTNKVVLTGFINQLQITLYYKAADIFVMCSGFSETWGLSVNEALNFGLPVVVSDTCGCAYDLVNESNGRIFETGNINVLANSIKLFLNKTDEENMLIAKSSLDIIDNYSYEKIIDGIKQIETFSN